jgi:hypothetical protein
MVGELALTVMAERFWVAEALPPVPEPVAVEANELPPPLLPPQAASTRVAIHTRNRELRIVVT